MSLDALHKFDTLLDQFFKNIDLPKRWHGLTEDVFISFFIPASMRIYLSGKLNTKTRDTVEKYIKSLQSDIIWDYYTSIIYQKVPVKKVQFEDDYKTRMLATMHCGDVLSNLGPNKSYSYWTGVLCKCNDFMNFKNLNVQSDAIMDDVQHNLIKLRLNDLDDKDNVEMEEEELKELISNIKLTILTNDPQIYDIYKTKHLLSGVCQNECLRNLFNFDSKTWRKELSGTQLFPYIKSLEYYYLY